ncbi:MFS transporter [Amycolatopsis sp. PS_44_ISF1]|uniref:MFS transporter n=1 Tax=Amycolatopsis sp. PS_44_ISF1 TaxID=2974917 RepID=UPI0028DF269E|nr:MFS transporter [Amycolatopsis sp. PS_44_ISF1]MDT8913105.1 MFS transporter [Amycolatopsis sp. PS_44_ISF1]
MPHSTERAGTRASVSHWLPLVAACAGTFLLLVHTSIITVALPSIGTELRAGYGELQWIVDVFTVALAGLLLGFGSVSDRLGRKRVHLAGLVLFTAATLGCGLAGSAGELIAARAVQGVAGAAMFATILPLVGLTYEGRDRARAFAVWGTVAGVASAVGTFAGGVIAQGLGWRWIFFATVPVGGAAIVLAALSLPESPRGAGRRVDHPGIATFSLAATGLTCSVITGGDRGWASAGAVAGYLVTVLAAGAFVLVERRSGAPVLPIGLFGTRRFLGVLAVAFGYYFAGFGALPVISLWLQDTTGLGSAATSAVLALQVVVFVAVSALISGRLHARSPARVLGGATVLLGIGGLTAVAVLLGAGWVALLPALVLTGIGAGIVSPVLPAVAIASVPAEYGGTAGAAANSSRQLGLALGIAVSGAVYAARGPGSEGATHGVLTVLLLCGLVALASGFAGGWLLRTPTGGTRTK